MQERISVYIDGGSRGNPGPGAAGYVLTDADGRVTEGEGFFLGQTTNNVAEYTGMLKALDAARKTGAESIDVFSDSELVVRQINGEYKVKNQNLKVLYGQCMDLLSEFANWQVRHIPRDRNKEADGLVNRAMDLKRDVAMKKQNSKSTGRKLRLGILISGGGRTMENIQNRIDQGDLNAEIAVVICSRSTVRGVELAKKLTLKLEIVRRKDFADIEQFSLRLEQVMAAAEVDLVIQAGWLCLWKIPERYKNRVMNIHPALLPNFGGKGMWGHHVHEAVLKTGCKVSGCTVHFCTDEYDKGQIIVQRSCQVKDDDDADSLAARVFEQECFAYPEAIQWFYKKWAEEESSNKETV